MSLPFHVDDALDKGELLMAEVPAKTPDCKAYVMVQALQVAQLPAEHEMQEKKQAEDWVYDVQRFELPSQYVDDFEIEHACNEQQYLMANKLDLELILRLWMPNMHGLVNVMKQEEIMLEA
ncbi:MAG: hypothetical protein OEY38_04710 [Gammaproteobacteria bacterium]|nr:hypothetical protein [Gammaproteobacteria bacterium]